MSPKTSHIVRHYPLSLFCILLIWVLSLTPFFPETPFDDVAFMDKWTHFIMYGGTCAVIWGENLRFHRRKAQREFATPHFDWSKNRWEQVAKGENRWERVWAMMGMVVLGGLMELLQAYCTTTRSGEWLDFWADSVGVLIGTAIGLLMKKTLF